jgi:nicotinamide riboside kinase
MSDSIQRVVLTGAECTGKSSLTRALAKRLGEPFSSEYVREHVESIDRPLEAIDLDPIARGQLRGEDIAHAQAERFVLHDTNLLSSILYADHYFGVTIPWVNEVFLRRSYDHYFLCLPDFPWEADPGQRVDPKERDNLHICFKDILQRYQIPYSELDGSLEARISKVCEALNQI